MKSYEIVATKEETVSIKEVSKKAAIKRFKAYFPKYRIISVNGQFIEEEDDE